jgi:hypothetical protein
MGEGCMICDQSWMRAAEISSRPPLHIRLNPGPGHPGTSRAGGGRPARLRAIVPIAHRTSVFELTPMEWADVQDLLLQARLALHDLLPQTAICLAGTRAVPCIPICMSFHDPTTSHRLTTGCARRSTSWKTDGPTHGRPGAAGHFGVTGESRREPSNRTGHAGLRARCVPDRIVDRGASRSLTAARHLADLRTGRPQPSGRRSSKERVTRPVAPRSAPDPDPDPDRANRRLRCRR